MKDRSKAAVDEETQRAKRSMKRWIGQARSWDYHELCSFISNKAKRLAFVERLQTRGFFVENLSNAADLVSDAEPVVEQPTAVASAEEALPRARTSEEPAGPAEEGRESEAGSGDPIRPKYVDFTSKYSLLCQHTQNMFELVLFSFVFLLSDLPLQARQASGSTCRKCSQMSPLFWSNLRITSLMSLMSQTASKR